MVRYFGPGHTGTVETIFRLAVETSPGRWDKSAISASERKIWDELREGTRSVKNVSLDQMLLVEVPRPHDPGLVERYCDVMDACQALRMLLDNGAIRANYRDENGVQHAVPVEFWRGDDARVITALLNGVESNDEPILSRLLRLPTHELNKAWPELISRGFRESKGDETTEHGVDLDAADLVEVMPRLQGDAGLPKAGRNDAATAPTKTPSRKVLSVANELKRLYPDGLTIKTFKELGKALETSESTVKRAFSCNGWSRTRAEPRAK
jgi:hypothetical protein